MPRLRYFTEKVFHEPVGYFSFKGITSEASVAWLPLPVSTPETRYCFESVEAQMYIRVGGRQEHTSTVDVRLAVTHPGAQIRDVALACPAPRS